MQRARDMNAKFGLGGAIVLSLLVGCGTTERPAGIPEDSTPPGPHDGSTEVAKDGSDDVAKDDSALDVASDASPDAPDAPDASVDALDAALPETASDAIVEVASDTDARDAPLGGDSAPDAPPVDAAPDADATLDVSSPGDASVCTSLVQQHAIEAASHVPVCSQVTYGSNPPSSGMHYPYWPAFKSYGAAIPRGFYVHGLEHGAVVLTYDCPAGCAAEVAAAQAMIDGFSGDLRCPDDNPQLLRVIMTPDPLIGTRWAASAWGYTLRADCFDAAVFSKFIADHVGMGTEPVCYDGSDLSSPDGGVTLPDACLDGGTDAGGG